MPLLLVALERVLAILLREVSVSRRLPGKGKGPAERQLAGFAISLFVLLGLAFTPSTVTAQIGWHGVVDERRYYTETRRDWAEESRRSGKILRRFFSGVRVRVAFFGGEARVVYYADPAVAIESAAGLTDAFVARRKLLGRGRVGHEKAAPAEYLLERRIHFSFDRLAGQVTGLDRSIPFVPIDFNGVAGRVVTWEPAVMAAMKSRGARFPDLPQILDGEIGKRAGVAPEVLAERIARLEAFLFMPASGDARRGRSRVVLEQLPLPEPTLP